LLKEPASSEIADAEAAPDLADAEQFAQQGMKTPPLLESSHLQALALHSSSEPAQFSASIPDKSEVSAAAVPPAQQLAAEAPPITEPSSGVKHDPSPG
jgi:hypothetical protein